MEMPTSCRSCKPIYVRDNPKGDSYLPTEASVKDQAHVASYLVAHLYGDVRVSNATFVFGDREHVGGIELRMGKLGAESCVMCDSKYAQSFTRETQWAGTPPGIWKRTGRRAPASIQKLPSWRGALVKNRTVES